MSFIECRLQSEEVVLEAQLRFATLFKTIRVSLIGVCLQTLLAIEYSFAITYQVEILAKALQNLDSLVISVKKEALTF